MRLNLQSAIVLLLLYNVITFVSVVCGQDFQQTLRLMAMEGERDKRALDLGLLVRNFLMKSAYASNTKAAVSRNLINLKTATTTTTTPRPTTTRRRPVVTTLAPFFAKKSFLFPFDFSNPSAGFAPFNKFNNVPGVVTGAGPGPVRGGYFNFDYDYNDQRRPVQPPARRRRPTTTTAAPTTTTTTTAAPTPPPSPAPQPDLPLRRRPLPKRPTFVNYDDYYDDYDYGEAEPTTPAPPPPPPPSPSARPRSRSRSRSRRPQQNQATPPLIPPRNGARQDRPPRLRNPTIYQYAPTNDFSTNNANGANAAASTDDANNANPNADNQSNNANDETSQDTNEADNDSDADDDANANVPANDEAALDPSNPEDYDDSSDNSNTNPNSNGSGSNGNNLSFNDADNEPPAQNPLFDFDNANSPAAPPPPPQSNYGAQFPDPRNFNGHRNSNGRGRGPPPPLPQHNQPYGLPSDYQNFPYPSFNDFGSQYQQPSAPTGYSVRYY